MSEPVVNVKGLSDLHKFLQELPVNVERKILRSALRAGANVVREQARANIHRVSGVLADSLKVGTRARGGQVTANVNTKVFYARFVEFGTRPHTITARDGGALRFGGVFVESVNHPGIVSPRPFMRPALDTMAQAAVVAVGEQIQRRLTKEGLNASGVLIEGDE